MHNVKLSTVGVSCIILMDISSRNTWLYWQWKHCIQLKLLPLCLSRRLYLIMSSLRKIMADYTGFHCLSFCRSLLYLLDALGKKACRSLQKITFYEIAMPCGILHFLSKFWKDFLEKKKRGKMKHWSKKAAKGRTGYCSWKYKSLHFEINWE